MNFLQKGLQYDTHGLRKIGQSKEAKESSLRKQAFENATKAGPTTVTISNESTYGQKLFQIREFLLQNKKAVFTLAQIKEKTGVEVDEGLLKELQNKKNITVDDVNQNDIKLSYKPTFLINDIQGLRSFFRDRKNEGIHEDELADSYETVKVDLDTLENENFLIVIKPPARPKKPGKIYFYNETSFDVNLEKDLLTQLRTDYNTIKLPEKLEDEMRRKNMQPTIRNEKFLRPTAEKEIKKRKQNRRNKKCTNAHMQDAPQH